MFRPYKFNITQIRLKNVITTLGPGGSVDGQKVASSNTNEVTDIFKFTESFQLRYCPEVHSAPNRNEYKKIFLGGKARPAR
jgi:hypothetical protein